MSLFIIIYVGAFVVNLNGSGGNGGHNSLIFRKYPCNASDVIQQPRILYIIL